MFVLMLIELGLFVSMLIFGVVGVVVFEMWFFVGVVLLFLIGFMFGNFDEDLCELFGCCVYLLILFFGFVFGNGIDLNVIVKSGLLGIVFGFVVIVVMGVLLILVDKFVGGGNGMVGFVVLLMVGVVVVNLVIIGEMILKFKLMVLVVMVIVVIVCFVMVIFVLILMVMWVKWVVRVLGVLVRVVVWVGNGGVIEYEGYV